MMKPTIFLITLFSLLTFTMTTAQETYQPGPNSWRYDRIPAGDVVQHSWESRIYPNTVRDYFVYVPAQYDASQPTALMVFQDGHAYFKEDGDFRVPIVFDNLISQGKMPVTIGLFINPGHDLDAPPAENPWRVSNRSIEYDEVSDTYARFLLEELIPELKKSYNISDDPRMRAIGGLSSGGICAFSAAWFRPDQFHKVLSHIGSFTDIRGGHNYPPMIRKSDKKDIKVFLQDGDKDLDNRFGNWWLANLQMEAALKFKDYEYKFVPGSGAHDGVHGGAILPESLTWLWSDVIKKKVTEGIYALPDSPDKKVMMSGKTAHFSEMTFQLESLTPANGARKLINPKLEQILIIKEGELEVGLGGETKTLGPNSVVFLLPGETGTVACRSSKASYYTMLYASDQSPDLERGRKSGGSFAINFNDLEYREHSKGGRRDFFHRSTAMCNYYEMHVTNLNPGIKSHEPHVHGAAEIILVIDGETEMEIGNGIYHAKEGDIYFLPSYTPHGIRNIGDKQCRYFAFQWER